MFLKKNGRLYSSLIPRFIKRFSIGETQNSNNLQNSNLFKYKEKRQRILRRSVGVVCGVQRIQVPRHPTCLFDCSVHRSCCDSTIFGPKRSHTHIRDLAHFYGNAYLH